MNRFAKSFCFALLVPLAACQAPNTQRPQLTPEEVRAEEMAQQEMVSQIQAQGGSKKNWKTKKGMRTQFERVGSKVEEAAAEICRDLNLPAQGRKCYYHFGIKYDEALNASADGEKIVFNSGMLSFLQTDDELAAVMGHELAHNLMAHIDSARTNTAAGMVFGLLLDVGAAAAGVNTQGGFAQIGADAGRLSYSVDFEEEADYVGLYIAARAGYNIKHAPAIWRRMSIENPDAIYNARTHPSNASRFVALNKTINEIDYKRKNRIRLVPELKPIEE